MKKITPDNYYEPDETIKLFGAVNYETREQWSVTEVDILNFVAKIEIDVSVPNDIVELIETSKALFAYGYLYWTFFTLAQEQIFKAFEAAISHAHTCVYGHNCNSKGKKLQLSDMIQRLIVKGNLLKENKMKYDSIRNLRNMSFHPSMQSQVGFLSYDIIKSVVDDINSLLKSVYK
ncbi:hypothetical protein EJ573_01445 [Paenibacillus polymyxa]|uniref:hypothetical protein n=1 Tax=Paenibacillus polymyxa TaxID=1406 RepID=UPI000F85F71F|nr:hypothetical protein [Paenibacillus polymyxa]RTZ37900.1 hypothetical protein EJ573_01445 [Paenibacillus polymyxa]